MTNACRPLIYLASPYTKGDPCVNTNFQMRMFDQMMTDGKVIPIVPLWSHFQHTAFPRCYQDWVAYDLAIIPRLDACLRLDASDERMPSLDKDPSKHYHVSQSSGADGEVEMFRQLKLPVFYSIDAMYEWAEKIEGAYLAQRGRSGEVASPAEFINKQMGRAFRSR